MNEPRNEAEEGGSGGDRAAKRQAHKTEWQKSRQAVWLGGAMVVLLLP